MVILIRRLLQQPLINIGSNNNTSSINKKSWKLRNSNWLILKPFTIKTKKSWPRYDCGRQRQTNRQWQSILRWIAWFQAKKSWLIPNLNWKNTQRTSNYSWRPCSAIWRRKQFSETIFFFTPTSLALVTITRRLTRNRSKPSKTQSGIKFRKKTYQLLKWISSFCGKKRKLLCKRDVTTWEGTASEQRHLRKSRQCRWETCTK